MTTITALEIFGNPKDLSFCIKGNGRTKMYALAIARGPGHNYKPLLTGEDIPDSKTAVGLIREVLDAALKCGLENLPRFGGEKENCLTEKQKDEILLLLEQKGECSTYV